MQSAHLYPQLLRVAQAVQSAQLALGLNERK